MVITSFLDKSVHKSIAESINALAGIYLLYIPIQPQAKRILSADCQIKCLYIYFQSLTETQSLTLISGQE